MTFSSPIPAKIMTKSPFSTVNVIKAQMKQTLCSPERSWAAKTITNLRSFNKPLVSLVISSCFGLCGNIHSHFCSCWAEFISIAPAVQPSLHYSLQTLLKRSNAVHFFRLLITFSAFHFILFTVAGGCNNTIFIANIDAKCGSMLLFDIG